MHVLSIKAHTIEHGDHLTSLLDTYIHAVEEKCEAPLSLKEQQDFQLDTKEDLYGELVEVVPWEER